MVPTFYNNGMLQQPLTSSLTAATSRLLSSKKIVCRLSSLAQSSNMNGSGDGSEAEADIKEEVEAKSEAEVAEEAEKQFSAELA